MPGVEKLSKAAVLNALGQRRHVAKRGNLGSFNCFLCMVIVSMQVKLIRGLGMGLSSGNLVRPIHACSYQ